MARKLVTPPRERKLPVLQEAELIVDLLKHLRPIVRAAREANLDIDTLLRVAKEEL